MGWRKEGVYLVFEATTEEMAKKGKGYTAEFLKRKLTPVNGTRDDNKE